ncbi:uncharacterized protein BO80DRAFT_259364 [Aspergillus ibericus CBS 121593]|uniref:Uncharacterized protein n=1 Tax=Aspergillus ibericus CBS 121593 TaxID=1448316 RepID=A0A395H8T3_9EURO|nr:hypothetical protein BO80DRAFT_259364 [Aspergillus ibericus CBS 121593]RAL04252.1 hypothetical protein BO80DRAFT_259364 [Aspergillus ibericus CBS 121593]
MSLITDEILLRLWEKAQAQPSNEWASAKLWSHLWVKHFFVDKSWVVSQETPPEGNGRRRVDITIEYMGSDKNLAVLAFHEAKALSAGPQDVEDAERPAYDACMRYLGEHPDLQFVYAFTSFGTKGRAWRCRPEDDYLSPLFGSEDLAERDQYIEVHSSDASLIKRAVQAMRAAPPVM